MGNVHRTVILVVLKGRVVHRMQGATRCITVTATAIVGFVVGALCTMMQLMVHVRPSVMMFPMTRVLPIPSVLMTCTVTQTMSVTLARTVPCFTMPLMGPVPSDALMSKRRIASATATVRTTIIVIAITIVGSALDARCMKIR